MRRSECKWRRRRTTYRIKKNTVQRHKFIIFYLNDDERQSVDVEEVEEVEEVNFFEVT